MDNDTDEPKKKKGRFRRALPNMPRIRRGELRVTEEYKKLRQGMAETRHLCPHDGDAMDLVDVYQTDATGEIPIGSEQVRALVCPTCSYTVPAQELAELFRKDAAPLKRAEKQFMLFAFGILVLFGIITYLNQNILTLLGALVFSLTLLLNALFYRYRHWQAVEGKMFLAQSPVKEWIAHEWSKS